MPDQAERWILKTYLRAWQGALPLALIAGVVFGTVSWLHGDGWRSASATLILWPALLLAGMTVLATVAVAMVSVYRLFGKR